MDAVVRKIHEVDLNPPEILDCYYDNNTAIMLYDNIVVFYDFSDPTYGWKETKFNYDPFTRYHSSFYDNETLVIMGKTISGIHDYLVIINTKTRDQQLLVLNRLFGNNPNKLLLGFQNRSVFIGCYDDVEDGMYRVTIKEMSIDDLNIFDVATVTINGPFHLKVMVSYNGERLLFSKSNNICTITSLSSERNPLFYSDLTLPNNIANNPPPLGNREQVYEDLMLSRSPIELEECFIVNRPGKDIFLFRGYDMFGNCETYYTILGEDSVIFRLEIRDENDNEIDDDDNHRVLLSTSVSDNTLNIVYVNTEEYSQESKIEVFAQNLPTIIYNPTKGAYNR